MLCNLGFISNYLSVVLCVCWRWYMYVGSYSIMYVKNTIEINKTTCKLDNDELSS